MKLFKRSYSGESLVDLERDMFEALDPQFNPQAAVVPKDEHGFLQGEFIITINWIPDNEQAPVF